MMSSKPCNPSKQSTQREYSVPNYRLQVRVTVGAVFISLHNQSDESYEDEEIVQVPVPMPISP